MEPVHEENLYEFWDRDVVRHVFRVASAMDSMVIGEPQILGQLKDAYRTSVEANACGPVLSRLFQRAFSTAKRVKNETRIAERPVSDAKVAVDLAKQIFERLDGKRALLVGAGEMIEASIVSLRREGLVSLAVANRTVAHAEELAGDSARRRTASMKVRLRCSSMPTSFSRASPAAPRSSRGSVSRKRCASGGTGRSS